MNRLPKTIILPFLLCLALPAAAAETRIAPDAESVQPLKAGDRAPSFTVYRVDGSPYRFEPSNLDSPVLIITYRGGWCPYCNTQLQDLRKVLPAIRESGVETLFLSGDRPEILYSSLKQDTRESVSERDYTILSDADMNAAMALGIAFRVPDSTLERYRSRDWDLAGSSMAKHDALPVPAVFVIDTDGRVAFAYANPDYRVRLPAEDVKAAVDRLLAGD